ncbi:hypothetical protein POM88_013821 [Heracleum sosnowskyi]|uniref:Uncharacterized protein n=1 Tax=Heracleum sosnowskyi TaxID=360622 RepID=A0AAD8J2W9_9APIA|nr:hypothetical protein POM88_013821 [Heracleum sosnowskyi]
MHSYQDCMVVRIRMHIRTGIRIDHQDWKLIRIPTSSYIWSLVKHGSLFCRFLELVGEVRLWGAFGQYALMTLGYLVAGLGGGFLYFFFSAFMLLAWFSFSLSIKSFGRHSLRSAACYSIPLLPCILYVVYFGGVLIQFLIEKMGMMGFLPPPYGQYLFNF